MAVSTNDGSRDDDDDDGSGHDWRTVDTAEGVRIGWHSDEHKVLRVRHEACLATGELTRNAGYFGDHRLGVVGILVICARARPQGVRVYSLVVWAVG